MPGMEVDKETFFIDSSGHLAPPDFVWCQNDSQTVHIWPHMELGSKGWKFIWPISTNGQAIGFFKNKSLNLTVLLHQFHTCN
jgi:hypothetical protein